MPRTFIVSLTSILASLLDMYDQKGRQNSAQKGTVFRTIKRRPKGNISVPPIFLSVTFFSGCRVEPDQSVELCAPLGHTHRLGCLQLVKGYLRSLG